MKEIITKSLLLSSLLVLLTTFSASGQDFNFTIKVKKDTIYFPGGSYIGEVTDEDLRNGVGKYELIKGFKIRGLWEKDKLVYGTGTFKRGENTYSIEYSDKVAGKIDPYDLYDRLWDKLVLEDLEKSKKVYERFMKGQIFSLEIKANDFYIPTEKDIFSPLTSNVVMTYVLAPIDESRLLYIQYPTVLKEDRAIDYVDELFGFFIGVKPLSTFKNSVLYDLFIEGLADFSIYNYVIVDNKICFEPSAGLPLKNCHLSDLGLLCVGENNIIMDYKSTEIISYIREYMISHGTDIEGFAMKNGAKDKTGEIGGIADGDYYLTSVKRKKKYEWGTDLVLPEDFKFSRRAEPVYSSIKSEYTTYEATFEVLVSREGEAKEVKYIEGSERRDKYGPTDYRIIAERSLKSAKYNPAVFKNEFVEDRITVQIKWKR